MKRTALFASIALAAGLATPAFAQEIAGTTVTAEDWPHVEAYCAELGALDNQDAFENAPESPAELSTSSIELDTLTRDDCVAAGLVDGAPEAGTVTESASGEGTTSPDDNGEDSE